MVSLPTRRHVFEQQRLFDALIYEFGLATKEGAFGNTRHERNVIYAPLFSEWELYPKNGKKKKKIYSPYFLNT
jgi:hypothetical protein